MPRSLKIRASGTDARAMSDTAVTPGDEIATPNVPANIPDGMFLDGEAPRLGSAPIIPPAPMGGAGIVTPTTGDGSVPVLPVVSPVLSGPTDARFAAQAPPVPDTDLPTLPTAGPVIPSSTEGEETPTAADDAEPRHPMAHLMPPKSKPTEASIRAAEQRAIKKAKAKKIKIAVAAGALVVGALAGPPFVSWLTNAVNETGKIEQPAD